MKILFAVDGSEHSHTAAHVLTHVADPQVILLHVIEHQVPHVFWSPKIEKMVSNSLEQHLKDDANRFLNDLAEQLTAQAVASKRLEKGKPLERIVEVAREAAVDLILLGSRGLGAVHELVLGSVSHGVAVHAPCPTLIAGKPMLQLKRLLVAVEGAEDVESAATWLGRAPFREAPEVVALAVVPYEPPASPARSVVPYSALEEMLARARATVDQLIRRLQTLGLTARAEVDSGAPATRILDHAAKCQADLIVMGSRRRGLARLGSVSHAVLHRTEQPVLVLR